MAHQDDGRTDTQCSQAHDLHRALQWLLSKVSLTCVRWRSDCTWTPLKLVFAGLLWAWSDEKTLIDRFVTSRKMIVHLYPHESKPAKSYQAFLKLLRKWTGVWLDLLREAFRQRTASLAQVWTVAGWIVFAGDGSRIDVPRTRSNEQHYAPQSALARAARRRRVKRSRRTKRRRAQELRQRKANVPQIWLTTLWHVGSGLPWDWRTGPSDSSEREHLREMLPAMPKNSLLTADAGFVGYPMWEAILAAGHQLLIRVGGNVRLLKKLGYARERQGLVYLWSDRAAKKRLPPLVLRLIVVHGPRHPLYLVTSVMNIAELSDAQATAIYRRRWGIELFYRHCKQTFERRKLRSHNAENAMLELHWSLLGVWAIGLHSHHRLVPRGVLPERISFAKVLRAYRRSMREYKSPPDPGERLLQLLDRAILDDYQRRDKTSRDYPRKKHEPAAGPPIIQFATAAQIGAAKDLKANSRKRLTA